MVLTAAGLLLFISSPDTQCCSVELQTRAQQHARGPCAAGVSGNCAVRRRAGLKHHRRAPASDAAMMSHHVGGYAPCYNYQGSNKVHLDLITCEPSPVETTTRTHQSNQNGLGSVHLCTATATGTGTVAPRRCHIAPPACTVAFALACPRL